MKDKDKNKLAKAPANTALQSATPNFEADQGQGMEGADKASYAIPFLLVLQGQSPQLETVDGAKPGKLLNSITNEVASEVLVVPCAFQRRYLRWASREEGGGFRGEFHPADVEAGKVDGVTKDDDGRYKLGNDELKDTRSHFVLAQDNNGAWHPALLSLSSTQIKKSKRWMSRIGAIELRDKDGKAFTPPSFSHIYRVTTLKEENAKGAWYGLDINLVGPVQDAALYAKAKAFHASVISGAVEVAPPPAAGEQKF